MALWGHLAVSAGGQGLVINEVYCTGPGPDRVELLNTGPRPVSLDRLRFSMEERTAVLRSQRVLDAGQRCEVVFSGSAAGTDTVPFGLPANGGTLLLIAPDGQHILDVAAWPSMPPGTSIGRQPDGATGWSFFADHSLGLPNVAAPRLQRISQVPLASVPAGRVHPGTRVRFSSDGDGEVRWSLDAGAGMVEEGRAEAEELIIDKSCTVYAQVFSNEALPSAAKTFTYVVEEGALPVLALCIPDCCLTSRMPGRGTVEGVGAPSMMVDWRESGSGSRSLPKRNFKLAATSHQHFELPTGWNGRELLLRADASPHAFLRNTFMELIVARTGSRVAVQPSMPVDLYLNGRYHGLYRAMPPKDEDWLRTLHGAEAFDVLHGPSLRKVDGDRTHFHDAYEALLAGLSMDTLERLVDVASLIDLACFDLWTGRADHDLNVRCYRPKEPGGRWRWVLYDMDLWAPVEENSLVRMCSEAAPVAPYLPQLLRQPDLRDRFLARMVALNATVLSPSVATPMADSLFEAHRQALATDHALWTTRMNLPSPDVMRHDLSSFCSERGTNVMAMLASRTGKKRVPMEVACSPMEGGSVYIEGLAIADGEARFEAFAKVPLSVQALPAPGWVFAGWKNGTDDPVLVVDPADQRKMTAVFRRAAGSGDNGL